MPCVATDNTSVPSAFAGSTFSSSLFPFSLLNQYKASAAVVWRLQQNAPWLACHTVVRTPPDGRRQRIVENHRAASAVVLASKFFTCIGEKVIWCRSICGAVSLDRL